MISTDHMLLRAACEQLLSEYQRQIENEWHQQESYHRIAKRIARLESFKSYVKYHEEFSR